VEEAQSKQQLPELLRVVRAVEESRVTDRIDKEGVFQIRSQPSRCLVGHLDSVLEDRHREVVVWLSGEPEAEITMTLSWVGQKIFADLLEGTHPRLCQVAVL
jgi:hypothetical protein